MGDRVTHFKINVLMPVSSAPAYAAVCVVAENSSFDRRVKLRLSSAATECLKAAETRFRVSERILPETCSDPGPDRA